MAHLTSVPASGPSVSRHSGPELAHRQQQPVVRGIGFADGWACLTSVAVEDDRIVVVNETMPRVDTEVVEVNTPGALSKVVQWLSDEARSTMLISAYDLEASLLRAVDLQGEVVGVQQALTRWRRREDPVDRTPVWMIEVLDLFESRPESFASAYRERGILGHALTASTQAACLSVGLATALLAGHAAGFLAWDEPVEINALLRSRLPAAEGNTRSSPSRRGRQLKPTQAGQHRPMPS